MSHCASFLCLNGLFESSFFTPSISQQATNTNSADKSVSSVSFVLQKPRKLANVWRDETLELAEICSQRATRCWNRRKFLVSAQQGTGTTGNSFTASNNALERAEISSPRATRRWNGQKFVARERRESGTSGNCRSAVRCLPSFPTENSRGELEKHKNSQSLFTLQTTAAGGGGKK